MTLQVTNPALPSEVLGPLGLTVVLLLIVGYGARFLVGFIREVIADLRSERDKAREDKRTALDLVNKQADSIDLVADGQRRLDTAITRLSDAIRDGTVSVRPKR